MGPVSELTGNDTRLLENSTNVNKSTATTDSSWDSAANESISCSTQKCKYGLLNDMQVGCFC